MLELRRHVDVHAFAHVTGRRHRRQPAACAPRARGGGRSSAASWERPRIFDEIQAAGSVADDEMEQVFNLGLGMLAVVPSGDVFRALDVVRAAGHEAWPVGEIRAGHGAAASRLV